MRFRNVIFVGTILIGALSSCRTASNISYFDNVESVKFQPLTENENKNDFFTTIAIDDNLIITVSALDPSTVTAFNLPLVSYPSVGQSTMLQSQSIQTYLVDKNGNINFPVLGKLNVAGLIKEDCISLLVNKISEYVDNPIVNVRIENFQVSVLGEVNSPGTYRIDNEYITVLDALGQAKDMTIYGDRTNVMLIRTVNGKKEFHRFDLTDANILNSPYFYLKQNDVLYVEPNSAKKKNAKYSQTDAFNVTLFSAVVSSLSVIASLLIALLVK